MQFILKKTKFVVAYPAFIEIAVQPLAVLHRNVEKEIKKENIKPKHARAEKLIWPDTNCSHNVPVSR